jgi:hypothetical protein
MRAGYEYELYMVWSLSTISARENASRPWTILRLIVVNILFLKHLRICLGVLNLGICSASFCISCLIPRNDKSVGVHEGN